jgi:choline dehydrogenase-like flavoprotein
VIRDVTGLEDGAVLTSDVAVVGAGFAGVELARYLGRNGVRVVLVESGRMDFDPETQELVRVESVGKELRRPDPYGEFAPYLEPAFRGEGRIRQFGGTSNVWTGKWRFFDPADFEPRPWFSHSGWPIEFEELRPFYEEVARDHGWADLDVLQRNETLDRMRAAVQSAGLEVSVHAWQRKPLRVAAAYTEELRRSETVDVILGATATEILLAEGHERVRAIACRSLEGRRLEVEAEQFVLATGGLEAPRLLLASNRQLVAGVGNEHDLVGRFFMDHPKKRKRGTLRPGPALRAPSDVIAAEHPRFQLTFSLSADTRRERSLLSHVVYFEPVFRSKVGYPAMATQMIRDGLRARDTRLLLRGVLRLARTPRGAWLVLRNTVRPGSVGPLDHYAVSVALEQEPNPQSRVYLDSNRDAVGMPKLVVEWRLSRLDRESFGRMLDGLKDAFAKAGIGTLDFGPELQSVDDTVDSAHQIGATRMASSPMEGVVDPDCRVFGTENLFVASMSVFPTGGTTGPTFTVLALARRLGAHLLALRAPGRDDHDLTGKAAPDAIR